MKIIYRQKNESSALTPQGITDCCVKKLRFGADSTAMNKKQHFHNEFEIHAVLTGCQVYEVNGKRTPVTAGKVLVIPPAVAHRATEVQEQTEKLALSFKLQWDDSCFMLPVRDRGLVIPVSDDVVQALDFVQKEACHTGSVSLLLAENRIFEAIVLMLRKLGLRETQPSRQADECTPLLLLAKQYIADNIEAAPTVHDTARYCHISDRQLTRVFMQYEEMSAFAYIRRQRVLCAERLLREGVLSVKQISEKMNFSSEYYFNDFIKKNCGMSPGLYRKML